MRPPSPTGLPLVGHLRQIRADAIGFYGRVHREQGPIAGLALGPMRAVLLTGPAGATSVLQRDLTDYHKGFGNHVLEPLLGQGLFLSEGDTWRQQRRLVQPLMQRANLGRAFRFVDEATTSLCSRWEDAAGAQRSLKLFDEIRRLSFSVVAQGLVGSGRLGGSDELADTVNELWIRTGKRVHQTARWMWRVPTPGNLRFDRALRRVNEAVHSIIQEQENGHGEITLLSLLRDSRDGRSGATLSDDQIRDEVMTFLLAGHECTAIAITWALSLAAGNPEVADEVHAEVESVRGEGPLTFEHLDVLANTKNLLNEALRLYPPAWIMARQATLDNQVQGFDVRKNSVALICPHTMHRSDRYFTDPHAFRPHRFRHKQQSQDNWDAFMPFGVGPRNCVGMNFARMVAHTVLAGILSRFTLRETTPRPAPDPGLTLRPARPILVVPSVR